MFQAQTERTKHTATERGGQALTALTGLFPHPPDGGAGDGRYRAAPLSFFVERPAMPRALLYSVILFPPHEPPERLGPFKCLVTATQVANYRRASAELASRPVRAFIVRGHGEHMMAVEVLAHDCLKPIADASATFAELWHDLRLVPVGQ